MPQANQEHRSILVLHPTGNAFVRQATQALAEKDMLADFHTTIVWRPGSALDGLLPNALRNELARRSYPDIPAHLVHTHPWQEMVRLVAIRRGWNSLIGHETGRFSMDAINGALDRKVARILERSPTPNGVYAYDDCALHTFAAARKHGIQCIYELPIGHYRAYQRIVEEERQLRPEWTPTLAGLHDSPEKLARKDQELERAESIFVASTFTARTLDTFPGPLTPRIYTVPYGAPPLGPPRLPTKAQDPLRVLYVGSIGQRKGISYLFEAVDQLHVPYTLTLLGRPVAMPKVMEKALSRFRFIESAPHAEVLRLMREHDVLVFPSLFEGFGLVILEAMAQGTVVVATPHTAAPDLLDDGRDGFIVPIRSAEAIAQRLTQLAENRGLLANMSEAAQRKASECTWERYRAEWMTAVDASFA